MNFKEYKSFNLSQINKTMLEVWNQEDLFHKSITTREGQPSFVFYEGPPSANGMPGIHHVMARTIKDTFCRYKTMKGFQVYRKAGWDTHGLPVELGVEKELGITKEDIGKKVSVDEYNAACRANVMKYTKEWTDLTKKMGYWVDLDNPYVTYDTKYMETLWYLLKELYKKNLLYKGYTIQPYSPAAGTGLSSHELNQPGCYRDVKDTTCTAQFKVKGTLEAFPQIEGSAYFIAWTTTPWTLPSNTALCVGPKIDYVAVKSFNPYSGQAATYICAKALLHTQFNPKAADLKLEDYKPGDKLVPFQVVGECKGADLIGTSYEQLIPWVNPGEGAFRVIAGDFVTIEDGTGVVHIAPTFGADDAMVAKGAGVPGLTLMTANGDVRPMVDLQGKFFLLKDLDESCVKETINVDLYKAFEGRYVKNSYDDALTDQDETLDVSICMMLKTQGLMFSIAKHVHSYPHCWRTDKPVIYYPLDSWFVKSTAAKADMIRLNKTINWKPESTGTGRFGKWLENLQDWNLSRSRYWGTPLPIWRTEDGQEKCIGSIEELMKEIDRSVAAGLMKENPYHNFKVGDFSKENYDPKVIDLHRPYIDNIILVSDDGQPMKRELDLIDVWFDSGAMPYAQIHYPFENKAAFDSGKIYPADFISEGVDQTRGWFFTLHALGTMIFKSVAFKNVISNGLVLDKNGNKMSKRLGNGVDPFGAIEKFGSDPLRWYMMTNASPWDNLKFDEAGVEEVRRKFFGTLYNTYSFFALYANVDGFTANDTEVDFKKRPEIDRWIMSELNTLIQECDRQFGDYEPTRAGRAIATFVNDNLSNWYVRLNRRRFWAGEMNEDKRSAYQTLYTCLLTVSKLMAPIAPFFADQLYRDLNAVCEKKAETSVHLSLFPEVNESLIDSHLEECMKLAQQASSMILALRRKAEKKVRQPLLKAVIPVSDEKTREQLTYISELIINEVNIKSLEVVSADDNTLQLVKRIKPNFKVLGKKYGKQMKAIAALIRGFNQKDIQNLEQKGQATLHLDGQDLVIECSDVEIATEDMPGWLVANEGTLTIALDIMVNEELKEEGYAREFVNRIQNMRKNSGFEITDKILVEIEENEAINSAVEHFKDYIASQVLADDLKLVPSLSDAQEQEFDDCVVKVKVTKM